MRSKIILILSIFFISINSVYAKEKVELSKCVDGDTIKIVLDDKEYTVRMLAVDTPESVHPTVGVEYYGKEASDYTCDLVSNANKIEIEYDDNSDKQDKYDRLLVWVFIDGELLQKKLIENGYAEVAYLYGDYKYTNELQFAQEKASAQGIGIWNDKEKEKYNTSNGITSDAKDKEDEEFYKPETITEEINIFIDKLKRLKVTDYLLIIILLLIIIFCGNKKIKSKAKKKIKKYFK